MAKTIKPPPKMWVTAALLYLGGLTWEKVAIEIGRHPRTVEKWREKQKERWNMACDEAEAQHAPTLRMDSLRRVQATIQDEDHDASTSTAQWALERLSSMYAPPTQRKHLSGAVDTGQAETPEDYARRSWEIIKQELEEQAAAAALETGDDSADLH